MTMANDDSGAADEASPGASNNDGVVGSAALRPVFLGNLQTGYSGDDVKAIFETPILPNSASEGDFSPMPVDRIDHKRGYCFIFLKDATSESEKKRIEKYIEDINGMNVPNVSNGLRAEFARGDGRVKRKEDERRKNIEPSDTLFVVNFHEQTTRREDLNMLFEPYGELVRIDMKRNYAFVQFRTIEQATKAKEATNGGKLDQSVLTVEYVARQRLNERRNDSRRSQDRSRGRYDDRNRPPPPSYRDRPPPPAYDRYDRYDDRYRRSRSPPYRRGRTRSRSRSPPPPRHYRSRSPPPRYADDRYGEYRRSSRSPSPPPPPGYRRGRSPPMERERTGSRDFYRGGSGGGGERGYR